MNWRTGVIVGIGILVIVGALAFFLREPTPPGEGAGLGEASAAGAPAPTGGAAAGSRSPAPGRTPRDVLAVAASAEKTPIAALYPSDAPRRSKLLPRLDMSANVWLGAIEAYRRQGNVIALFTIVEARPGSSPEERAQLLRQAL